MIPPAAQHVHREHAHAVALGVLHQRALAVKPHRLGVEDGAQVLGGVVVPQVGAGVDDQRKAGRVALGKPVVGKGVDLVVNAMRDVVGNAVGLHAGDHLFADGGHAHVAALVPHRLAQHVGLARGEAGGDDGHLHALLLKERDAKRALEHRLERRVRVRDRLLTGAPPQVRMHHLALDGPRPDERDLDDEVVEVARLQPWQRVHLRAALHLKDAHRVGAAEVVVHRLVGGVELREFDGHAARGAHVLDAVLQQRQHAEPEQVDLHEPHRVEVVLFPLDHGAFVHRGGFDGDDGAQRLLGEHKAAHMDAAVPRRLAELLDDVGERALRIVRGVCRYGAGRCLAARCSRTAARSCGRIA